MHMVHHAIVSPHQIASVHAFGPHLWSTLLAHIPCPLLGPLPLSQSSCTGVVLLVPQVHTSDPLLFSALTNIIMASRSAPLLELASGAFSFCRPRAASSTPSSFTPHSTSSKPSAPAGNIPETAPETASETTPAAAAAPPLAGQGWLLACAGREAGEVQVWDFRCGPAR